MLERSYRVDTGGGSQASARELPGSRRFSVSHSRKLGFDHEGLLVCTLPGNRGTLPPVSESDLLPPASDRYVLLARQLLDGLQPEEFCERFLAMWREDRDAHRRTGAIIDQLMTAVDCYEAEAKPGDRWAIDAAQLRAEAQAALDSLLG